MIGNEQLPSGYRSRPATLGDADGVAATIAAVELAHGHGTVTTAATVIDNWTAVDLDSESVVVEAPDGAIVAYADILNRNFVSVTLYAYVHPKHTGLGVGRFLVQWGETWTQNRMDQAPAGAQVDVRQFIPAEDPAAQELLQRHGYKPIRSTWVMQILPDSTPPEPRWPDGIHQTPFRPGIDERDVYEVIEEAFRDLWGRPEGSFEQFLTFNPNRESEADLWVVPRNDEGLAVGACIGYSADGIGWLGSVGVLRAYRRQGLGLALLHAGFGALYRRGIRDIRLSVDVESLTGAPRLYERAGMHPLSTYLLYQKILRPGVDLGDRTGA